MTFSSKNNQNRFAHGFTLIELLIVITLSVMLLLTASTLFMTLLIGNSKTNSAQLVKSEGSSAMSQIEFLLRGAIVLEACVPTSTSLTFESLDGGSTVLSAQLDTSDNEYKIASVGAGLNATPNTRFLSSGALDLVGGAQGINFTCVQSGDGSSNYVTVSFTLQKGSAGVDQARDIIQESFATGINLRSN